MTVHFLHISGRSIGWTFCGMHTGVGMHKELCNILPTDRKKCPTHHRNNSIPCQCDEEAKKCLPTAFSFIISMQMLFYELSHNGMWRQYVPLQFSFWENQTILVYYYRMEFYTKFHANYRTGHSITGLMHTCRK